MDEERTDEQGQDQDLVVKTREVHCQASIGAVQVKTSGGSPHIECKLAIPWDKTMAGELGDLQVSAKAPINVSLVYEEPQLELPVEGEDYDPQDEELDFEDDPEPGFGDDTPPDTMDGE